MSAALARVAAEGVESHPHVVSLRWQRFLQPRSRTMKKGRRNRQYAKFARLRRHLEISLDAFATPPHSHALGAICGRARGAAWADSPAAVLYVVPTPPASRTPPLGLSRSLERHISLLRLPCDRGFDGFRRSHRLRFRQLPAGSRRPATLPRENPVPSRTVWEEPPTERALEDRALTRRRVNPHLPADLPKKPRHPWKPIPTAACLSTAVERVEQMLTFFGCNAPPAVLDGPTEQGGVASTREANLSAARDASSAVRTERIRDLTESVGVGPDVRGTSGLP